MTGFPSFWRLNNIPWYVYTVSCLPSYRHLRGLQLLAIVTSTARNVGVPVALWDPAFNILTSEIAGPYADSTFNFWRSCHAIFHSNCIILSSHQQGQGFQFLHILTNNYFLGFVWFWFWFLIIATPKDVRWYLTVSFIWISRKCSFLWCMLPLSRQYQK